MKEIEKERVTGQRWRYKWKIRSLGALLLALSLLSGLSGCCCPSSAWTTGEVESSPAADESLPKGEELFASETLESSDKELLTEWENQIKAEILTQSIDMKYADVIHGTGKNGNPISVPYDWSCAEYLDTDTTFCYQMHGFLFLDASYAAYLDSGDAAYKDLIMDFMVDWVNSNPTIDFDNKWAWHDDAVARRVLRMSWYFSQWEQDFTPEDGERIKESLAEQADLLTQESFYKKRHNHGMYQDLGLTAYALLLAEEPLRQQYLDLAAERSREYFEFCFTEDGVHSEHSPAYQRQVAIELLRFSAIFSEIDSEYAQWLADLYEKTGMYLAEIVQPDNSWPSIGDSSRKSLPLAQLEYNFPEFNYVASGGTKGVQPPADIVFPQGGYAVMRSSWEDSPEEATYLLFMASTHSTGHKHGDDLSFILYHKGDLFVEAGNRDYNYAHEMTTYAYSGYAHNVLCVDDEAFPVSVSPSGWQRINKAAYNTKITSYDMDSPVKTASAVQTRFENVKQVRTLAYDKGNGVVTITDDLEVKKASKCTLLYHLAEGVEVQETDGGWLLLRGDTAVAQVTVSSSLPEQVELSAVTGGSEGSDPYYTWLFEGEKEPKIGSLLKVDSQCPAGAVQIVTTVVLL